MDFLALLASTPLVGLVPYLTFIIAVATAALLMLPAPTTDSSTSYRAIYGVLHLVGNLKQQPALAAPVK